ncbi:undecaprenyldiphospho-muramoylpentapeptide beta-N-acetylglucosaminyltransferase [Microscilla marina]|uniref:UDP-N-acetylglucosamine--N-acetylmuramyl-(pentapeptide) pyrophosphoryl-undecaprenol N-acetylglucosamine transferase n=1 Tax=Microscilla marina ATCC 23134 TaxID=313606 RepID=A1ZYV0_MICM2|nr:undecaprenyldiphospho-muramoylpentapeptide beta-N-acetylglucosaminyltransferase [Microscilla marina]EAY24447.1 undecaprenyldiphospho-muramoylpentapeptide beta-N-acetylglucosaminyltransferase [Microscilla marina ATCC 23134]
MPKENSRNQVPVRAIISGGGTGGHIYPAIAIANELKERHANTEILFVGAQGKMEMEKVPKAGYPIEGLWISGIQRSLSVDNLSFPFKLTSSLLKARSIIKKFKPNVAIGVGGFASGPLLYVASRMGVPSLIQEQNSYAGLTNKWLAKRVNTICVAYEGLEKYFPAEKLVHTGNPVRKDILALDVTAKRVAAFQHFGLDPAKKTILIVGGSLGARSINESISKDLHKIVNAGAQVLWQTGKNSFEENPDSAGLLSHPLVKRTEFIYEMDLAYALADIIVSRAGALAVSEICLVGAPAILVPFPFAAEDHQTKNVLALEEKNAAIHIKNSDAKNLLVDAALALLQDTNHQQQLAQNIRQLGKPKATEQIVDEVLKLV